MSMLHKLLFFYSEIKRFKNYTWGNWWNFRKGFKKSTISFCSITKSNYMNFVSDEEFRRMHPLNKNFSGIIDNKMYLPYLFKDYHKYLPEIFYFKDELGFLPLKEKGSANRVKFEDFLKLLKENKKLVLKHICSEVGKGFLLCEYKENNFCLNSRIISEKELEKVVNPLNDYIVEQFVSQNTLLSKINETSLNTIRLMLVWSLQKESFVLARCFQRFGCNGSVVDNLGAGNGILAYVDVDSGCYTGYGVMNIEHGGDVFVENLVHPNSGFVFKDKQVPNFNFIKSKTIEMLNSVSFLKFVALDVAITENSFIIIETNSYPDPAIAQYKFGFKADPNFDYFFGDECK